jgi:hypothetical protein
MLDSSRDPDVTEAGAPVDRQQVAGAWIACRFGL